MPLILLLMLVLACLPLSWPAPLVGGEYAPVITLACVVLSLLSMVYISMRTERLVRENRVEPAWRWYGATRAIMFYGNLGLFYLALVVGGWGYLARDWLTVKASPPQEDQLLPGAEFVVLAPYFVTLFASWVIYFSTERALRGSEFRFSRGSYVLFAFRQNLLLVLIPLGMIILQSNIIRIWPELLESAGAKGIGICGAFIVMGILPVFLPQILGLRRLDDDELRERLATIAKRVGVKYREIYVWETRGHLATALVAGLFGRARVIIFTDGILRIMPPEELETVFGHELGHARHWHIHFYGLFLVLSFATIGAAYTFAGQTFADTLQSVNGDLLTVALLFTMGLYLFLVFGFLSRKCERQADLMGCRSLDPQLQLTDVGIETFAKALDRVGNANSYREEKPKIRGPISFLMWGAKTISTLLATWQHGTLESRIDYLNRVRNDHRIAHRFQWYVFGLRCFLFVLLSGTLAAFVNFAGWRAIMQGF